MPRVVCPTCGERHYYLDPGITLSARQRAIYDAIGRHQLSTAEIVRRVDHWCMSVVWKELCMLEQLGEVERPDGPRSGWRQAVVYGLKEVQFHIA